jgi:hypothetical protein
MISVSFVFKNMYRAYVRVELIKFVQIPESLNAIIKQICHFFIRKALLALKFALN